MEEEAIEKLKKSLDLQLASEIAKSTVHEMAQLKETKTNKIFYSIAMVMMGIICITCIVFTSFVGIKLINFFDTTEIVIEDTDKEKAIDIDSGDGGNVSNIGNQYNNTGNITNGKE